MEVFGSFANGLSTWSSDLDLVVTGIMEPEKHTGGERLHGGLAWCLRPCRRTACMHVHGQGAQWGMEWGLVAKLGRTCWVD